MRRNSVDGPDGGFTLVEILVALIVVGLISILMGRTLSSASANVATSFDSVTAAQQQVRLSGLLRYDFLGATEVTVYGTAGPGEVGGPDTTGMCWSKSANSPLTVGANDWLWNINATYPNASILRGLIQLSVVTPAVSGSEGTWWSPNTRFVGYEIRRESGGLDTPFELFRTECDKDLNLVTRPERMASLGSSINALASGDGFLYCTGSSLVTSSSAPSKILPGTTPPTANYTFTISGKGDLAASNVVRAVNLNNWTQQINGTITSVTGSSLTLSSTTLAPVGWSEASVDRWLILKSCATMTGIRKKSAAFVALLPYTGVSDSLDTSSVIVLGSRLS